ncbi:formylglycine-generating enzyme family protein [Cohaesibacter celericrescens]|uniref:Sulfatase-modifying factor enzyme-like domain-containing protein n=1 Tax=Cohaesibacter celericrescens TaxID=2067669 RepID=A0A2N5XUM0_9HYPH|nr:SUMF1/EgtB/PvdO family nonheme iron enzyme [Cohaesibacter celericrescens]PLW78194.1 hypothetical protein C0081_06010 [Cohaesibacter celericrescens]
MPDLLQKIQSTLWLFLKVLLGLAAMAFMVPMAVAQQDWDPKYYNPADDPNVLLLPIPCGGKIALKRVVTVSEDTNSTIGPLADQRIVLGRNADRTRGYIEENHPEYISGTLNDPTTNERYYLLGAYEVTQGQYDAVMKGPDTCQKRMSRKMNVPITNVSWYDAVDFTRKLNTWIYQNADTMMRVLTQLGADNGFVRLPTEIEWEFATRGGSAVSTAERNEPLFFREGTIDDYAWYNGATSSGGKPKLIGKKKPNPVGLYDVYGNAEEIVLEPFRMTRSDRLHGAIGGFSVRGGSFLDSPDLINSARRDERPFFDTQAGGEFRRRTMGFRIMVGTANIPRDVSYVDRLETAYEETQRQVEGEAEDQPLQQMADAARLIENDELRAKIEALQYQLEAEFSRRNELKARNIRVTVLNGGLQAMEVFLSARTIKHLKIAYKEAKASNVNPQFYVPRIRAELAHYNLISNAYFETVETLADYDADDLSLQADVAKRELAQRGDDDMKHYVGQLETSISKFKSARNMQNVLHFLDQIPTATTN